MKAAVLYGKGDLRYVDWQEPKAAPGQIVVQVHTCGICGSDIPRIWGDAAHYYPIILGHEFAGDVIALGEGVTTFSVGDRVAGVPLLPCMTCKACQQGKYAACKTYSFIGSRASGALAERIAIPATNAVKLPDNVTYEMGAMFEPAAVALHGVLHARFRGGEQTAILGAGNIGLFTMQWVKAFGASSVTVFDVQQERLDLALKMGADKTVNLGTVSEETIKALNDSFGFIFETAGQFSTVKLSLDLAASHGRITCIGTPSSSCEFDWKQWEKINRKELQLTGTWMSYSAPFPGKEWDLSAEYFKKELIRLDPSMVFARYSLKDIGKAVELFQTPGTVRGKVLINID